ncbi:UBIQUITIN-CONJUGAT-2 domain-containing protein [Mycena venus]|uniref:UBIQUITIN-CONJUGAT-2 domain-containing protein n=1 Tax=Mycena venus TaxID=2733690 RepID=A0A8H6YGV2_9AGAR|nr:UBIQUITIN-CONJUGAT-2 domain-containing protein [Mycena venus]
MLDAPPTPPVSVAQSSALKNASLKGKADFDDLRAQGLELGGLAISKIRPGDDEGMIVVDRTNDVDDKHVVGCNIMCFLFPLFFVPASSLPSSFPFLYGLRMRRGDYILLVPDAIMHRVSECCGADCWECQPTCGCV